MLCIQPARFSAGEVPEVQNFPIVTDEAFSKGALVALASGEVEEHAGDTVVVGVLGIALEAVAAGVSLGAASNLCAVAMANRVTHFSGRCYDSGAPITDVSAVTVGDVYGLIKHTDGIWYVDLDDVANDLVEITAVDTTLGIVLFKFLESTLLFP